MIDKCNIRFKFRFSKKAVYSTRKTRVSVLYARLTINAQYVDFSARIALLPAHWDQAAQQVRPTCPDADRLNAQLARLRQKADKIWGDHDLRDEPISPRDLLRELQGAKMPVATLENLLTAFIDHTETRIGPATRPGSITESTCEVFTNYGKTIRRFLTETRKTGVTASAIDTVFVKNLESWLLGHYYASTVRKQLMFLKAVMAYGVETKRLRINPIFAYSLPKAGLLAPLVFLLPDELARLRATDFSTLAHYATIANRLDRVRDAFLIMHGIGQHYQDYVDFVKTPDNYLTVSSGIRFFKKKRRKTGQWAMSPVTDEMERLFGKYGGPANLPSMSNTKFNDYLKTVAAACGIDKNLTTKAARKSFADNHLNEQLTDSDTTARMMGLSSTTYLKHYGQTDERRLIKALNLTAKQKNQ